MRIEPIQQSRNFALKESFFSTTDLKDTSCGPTACRAGIRLRLGGSQEPSAQYRPAPRYAKGGVSDFLGRLSGKRPAGGGVCQKRYARRAPLLGGCAGYLHSEWLSFGTLQTQLTVT